MGFRNRAKCKNCGDIIESKYGHDYVTCTCFQESQAAMTEYSDKHHLKSVRPFECAGKTIYINEYDYNAMYKDPEYLRISNSTRGFMLDGGKGFLGKDGERHGLRSGGNQDDMIPMTEDDLDETIKQVQDTY